MSSLEAAIESVCITLTSARARAGCSLHLQCQLASSTPVTIRWWYNGLLLHEDKLPEVGV